MKLTLKPGMMITTSVIAWYHNRAVSRPYPWETPLQAWKHIPNDVGNGYIGARLSRATGMVVDICDSQGWQYQTEEDMSFAIDHKMWYVILLHGEHLYFVRNDHIQDSDLYIEKDSV